MKNRGFTLIELLAVVTIISIICILAIPPILNQVNNNKNAVSEANLEIIYKATDMFVGDKKANTTYCVALQELVDKDLLADPIQDFETGNKLLLSRQVKVVTDANKNATYNLLVNGGVCTPTSAEKPIVTYTEGTEIYYNPETNKKCTVGELNTTANAKTGCLKWNVITMGDTTSKTTVNIMLDHNTTANVAWASKTDYIAAGGTEADWQTVGNNNKGPLTANKQLQTDVTTWNSVVKSSARLISGQEVANIVKNTSWTTGGDFASLTTHPWLYQNLSSDNTITQPYGYWTSTGFSSLLYRAWNVFYGANLSATHLAVEGYYGVRPVITMAKSVIA